ncbi:hypothetical protein BU15DRAFT_66566 [Melanogaster broomeanus]|nr:hypothetical protein BU15DRAFT_66566 [Melanogaster broomeanus]
MHHALSIPELLEAIFGQIDGEDVQLWDDTLVALAQTCHTFHPIALDFLWASVNDINWLLRLIPSDARTHYSAEELRNFQSILSTLQSQTIRRDLTTAEWANFHKYTSRIRILDFQDVRWRECNLLISALRRCPCHPAFPKLESLTLDLILESSQFLAGIGTFLGPNLKSFTLAIGAGPRDPDLELGDLRALGAACPKLNQLFVHFSHMSWQPIISEMVSGCHFVKEFYCDRPLSSAALRHVARLPSLKKLQIAPYSLWSLLPDPSEMETAPPFTTGESTSDPSTISDNGKFLLPIRSAPAVLNLWCRAVPSTEDVRRLFNWLASLDAPSLLVDLELKAGDYTPFQNHLGVSNFQPFFRFRSLLRLTLDGICALPFNNSALQDIAEAYPQLEALSLNWESGWREPQITLHGLAWLFKVCRNLRELKIAIDATVLDPLPEGLTGPSVQNIHIETLYLANSPIADPAAVAGLLQEILPRLSSVDAVWVEDDTLDYRLPRRRVGALARSEQAVWGVI